MNMAAEYRNVYCSLNCETLSRIDEYCDKMNIRRNHAINILVTMALDLHDLAFHQSKCDSLKEAKKQLIKAGENKLNDNYFDYDKL